MKSQQQPMYIIPARFRMLENLHIVFWLLKDVSWCMLWKPLGLAMIAPTLLIAIFISWRTRNVPSEFAHNLAITFWITANSYWMISEFYGFDEVPIYAHLEGKHFALIPFAIGISILLHYYLFVRRKEVNQHEVVTM